MRYFSVESLRLMCDLLREHGLDGSVLLDAAGLAPDQSLADPTLRVGAPAELAVLRRLRETAQGMPGLAVQLGQRYRLATLGSLGMAMLSAPTVADSLQAALRYQGLSFSWLRFDGAMQPHVSACAEPEVCITLDTGQAPLDLRDFLLCRDVAAVGAMLRDLAGDEMKFVRVALNLADITQADGLQAYLGCPVSHTRGSSTLTLPADLLLRANRHHSVTAHALCLAACDAQLAALQPLAQRSQSRDSSVRVESMLHRHPGRLLAHEEVASMLGASERTLRRRLANEGTSFRDVRERVLQARAQSLLTSTTLNVSDVAEQLGFADASTFCQAFRRWFGQTPGAYRRAASQREVHYDLSITN